MREPNEALVAPLPRQYWLPIKLQLFSRTLVVIDMNISKLKTRGWPKANKSMENSPSVLFDALVLPDGEAAIKTWARDGHTREYVKDQSRHCKTILALGGGRSLLEKAGIMVGRQKDPGYC